jgi:hypothetical protein
VRLIELNARFKNSPTDGLFLICVCPKCGQHSVRVPVVVSPALGPVGARWAVTSLDLASLTCTPSIQHSNQPDDNPAWCKFHFSIASGEIIING